MRNARKVGAAQRLILCACGVLSWLQSQWRGLAFRQNGFVFPERGVNKSAASVLWKRTSKTPHKLFTDPEIAKPHAFIYNIIQYMSYKILLTIQRWFAILTDRCHFSPQILSHTLRKPKYIKAYVAAALQNMEKTASALPRFKENDGESLPSRRGRGRAHT
jgi:hypothetical protein